MDLSIPSLKNERPTPMCPPDLSSLKWGDDGELSPNDTLNLVEKLTRAEQESRQGGGASLNASALSQDSDSTDIS